MCDELKRQFYAACPLWYWPVLWWQFVIMERRLAALYDARGRTEMTYGLALGPRGELRLVFLSDAARRFEAHLPAFHAEAFTPNAPPAELLHHGDSVRPSAPQRPPAHRARNSAPLHIDPG